MITFLPNPVGSTAKAYSSKLNNPSDIFCLLILKGCVNERESRDVATAAENSLFSSPSTVAIMASSFEIAPEVKHAIV